MFKHLEKRNEVRKKRVMRVRRTLRGTSDKPRLSVSKTNKNLFVQVIDDEAGVTLLSYGTQSKELKGTVKGATKASAKIVGEKLAELAKGKEITRMVFDRGRFKYHGVIAEIVVAMRNSGMHI